jgi:hypothetical protein
MRRLRAPFGTMARLCLVRLRAFACGASGRISFAPLGCSAHCDERPKAPPLDSAAFEKAGETFVMGEENTFIFYS